MKKKTQTFLEEKEEEEEITIATGKVTGSLSVKTIH